jgi:hypothetical protein
MKKLITNRGKAFRSDRFSRVKVSESRSCVDIGLLRASLSEALTIVKSHNVFVLRRGRRRSSPSTNRDFLCFFISMTSVRKTM